MPRTNHAQHKNPPVWTAFTDGSRGARDSPAPPHRKTKIASAFSSHRLDSNPLVPGSAPGACVLHATTGHSRSSHKLNVQVSHTTTSRVRASARLSDDPDRRLPSTLTSTKGAPCPPLATCSCHHKFSGAMTKSGEAEVGDPPTFTSTLAPDTFREEFMRRPGDGAAISGTRVAPSVAPRPRPRRTLTSTPTQDGRN